MLLRRAGLTASAGAGLNVFLLFVPRTFRAVVGILLVSIFLSRVWKVAIKRVHPSRLLS